MRLPQPTRRFVSATLPGTDTRCVAVVALFAAIQIADGVLTLQGVSRFGATAEANPLLAAGIQTFGIGPALIAAKAAAVGFAALLSLTRAHLSLALLTVGYVIAAVVPWVWLLAR